MKFSFMRKYNQYKATTLAEFYIHINDLIEHEYVQKLDTYIHHHCFSRLKHSLDVAYNSFFIARLFGWDARSVARAGLLHDLYLYDSKTELPDNKSHVRYHPVIALQNAKEVCDLNKLEQNIIRRHMWLVTIVPPRYKEGFLVTFVDKYCAIKEFFIGSFSRIPVLAKAQI